MSDLCSMSGVEVRSKRLTCVEVLDELGSILKMFGVWVLLRLLRRMSTEICFLRISCRIVIAFGEFICVFHFSSSFLILCLIRLSSLLSNFRHLKVGVC